MPPVCSVCGRADRAAIDADVAAGGSSLASIAARYGISKSALIRHRDNHGGKPSYVRRPPSHHAGTRCEAVSGIEHAEGTSDQLEAVEPVTIRLREVATLLARGLSRAEIAARYSVHVDTVTVWTRTIRERGILRVRSTTAEEIVANLLHSQAQRARILWDVVHQARARGTDRVAVAALSELRREDQHSFEIAQDLGFFERYRPPQPIETSEHALQEMQQAGRAMLAMMSVFDDPQDVEDLKTRLGALAAESEPCPGPDTNDLDVDDEPLF